MQFEKRRNAAYPSGYGVMTRFVNALAVVLCLVWAPTGAWASDGKIILALGDSLTAGYGLAQSDAFPVQLQAGLRAAGLHDAAVINGGVSGDTSAGGRARVDWLLDGPVHLVIVELGANDGLRGLDPTETRKNLDAILANLAQRAIPVLLSGMLAPPNLGEDYGRAFNSIYPDLAKKYGVMLDAFFLQGVATDSTLNQADGLHPNAQGVAVIVKRLVPQIVNALKPSKKDH